MLAGDRQGYRGAEARAVLPVEVPRAAGGGSCRGYKATARTIDHRIKAMKGLNICWQETTKKPVNPARINKSRRPREISFSSATQDNEIFMGFVMEGSLVRNGVCPMGCSGSSEGSLTDRGRIEQSRFQVT